MTRTSTIYFVLAYLSGLAGVAFSPYGNGATGTSLALIGVIGAMIAMTMVISNKLDAIAIANNPTSAGAETHKG